MINYSNIAVIGSSSLIAQALIRELSHMYPHATISAFSRKIQDNYNNVFYYEIDYQDEKSISNVVSKASQKQFFDLIIVTNGVLHEKGISPEKSIKDLSSNQMQKIFLVNTITPAIIAKHFLAKISRNSRVVFASISARVGTITDNRLGGWYSYRASKAALNMIIKNIAIEMQRNKYNELIVVGLHPGTVATKLSEPFINNATKTFSPDIAAIQLINVLNNLTKNNSGKCIAWDGEEIMP